MAPAGRLGLRRCHAAPHPGTKHRYKCYASGVLVPPRAADSGATGGASTCAGGDSYVAPSAQPCPQFIFYLNGFAAGPCWTSQSRRVRLPIPVLHSPASPGESAPWEGFREARVQFSPSPANATAQASAELTLQCESRRHKLQTRWELNKTRASCPRSLVARFGRPRWCPWWCLPVVVGNAVHVPREGWDQWGKRPSGSAGGAASAVAWSVGTKRWSLDSGGRAEATLKGNCPDLG